MASERRVRYGAALAASVAAAAVLIPGVTSLSNSDSDGFVVFQFIALAAGALCFIGIVVAAAVRLLWGDRAISTALLSVALLVSIGSSLPILWPIGERMFPEQIANSDAWPWLAALVSPGLCVLAARRLVGGSTRSTPGGRSAS